MNEEHAFVVAGFQITLLGAWISLFTDGANWPFFGFIMVLIGTYMIGKVVARPLVQSFRG